MRSSHRWRLQVGYLRSRAVRQLEHKCWRRECRQAARRRDMMKKRRRLAKGWYRLDKECRRQAAGRREQANEPLREQIGGWAASITIAAETRRQYTFAWFTATGVIQARVGRAVGDMEEKVYGIMPLATCQGRRRRMSGHERKE